MPDHRDSQQAPTPDLPTYPFVTFSVPVVAGVVIHFLWNFELMPMPVAVSTGLPVFVAGTALGLWSVQTMFRHGEHPEPSRPTTQLIKDGPFRFSRNPSYVGLIVTATGLGLLLASVPVLASVSIGFAILALWVVPAEEKYLASLFGDGYRSYCARVRRWV